MNEVELKQKISELTDKIYRQSREDTRKAVFEFVLDLFHDRTAPANLTIKDLNDIRDLAIRECQELPQPAFVDLQRLDEHQRTAYCYLLAMIAFLHRHDLIKYLIKSDTSEPFIFSIHEE